MNETSAYQKHIQLDEGSNDTYEAEKLEKKMGYRRVLAAIERILNTGLRQRVERSTIST